MIYHIISLLLAGWLNHRDHGEIAINTVVLLILGRVHGWVVGRKDDKQSNTIMNFLFPVVAIRRNLSSLEAIITTKEFLKVQMHDEVWGNKVKVTFTKKNENERMYLNEIGVYNERRD